MVTVEVRLGPVDVPAVPGGCITWADRDWVVVHPPVGHAVDPRLRHGVAVDQVLPDVLPNLVGGDAVPHVVPRAAEDVQPVEDVPQARNLVEVNGLAAVH